MSKKVAVIMGSDSDLDTMRPLTLIHISEPTRRTCISYAVVWVI